MALMKITGYAPSRGINIAKSGNLMILITTRARSRWGAIANPHAKVFDSLQSHPGA